MKTPKRKNKPKKSRRSHIPPLSTLELEAAIARLKAARMPAQAKGQLEAMLRAASNPGNEHPAVILKTLEPERQQNAAETARAVGVLLGDTTSRGRAALEALSDEEWERLIGDA